MNIFRSIKKRWNKYLIKLAKSNDAQYGSKRLECCDLNKKNK